MLCIEVSSLDNKSSISTSDKGFLSNFLLQIQPFDSKNCKTALDFPQRLLCKIDRNHKF